MHKKYKEYVEQQHAPKDLVQNTLEQMKDMQENPSYTTKAQWGKFAAAAACICGVLVVGSQIFTGAKVTYYPMNGTEIVENFGGMLLHREDRLGFAPKEALEILENTTFKNSDNRFFEDFKFFLDVFESVQGLGLVTKLQRNINKIKRDDISSAVRAIYDHRDNIENVFMLTEHELFEDEISFFNLAKISAKKTVALINYNRKMSLANLGLRNNNN